MVEELSVISDFYDFMLWLARRVEKFPRHHRHSLGLQIENRLQQILKLLLTAKFSREKEAFLNEANLELEILRFQLRLAKDLKILTIKSQGFAATSMANIGRQIGAWLKQKRRN